MKYLVIALGLAVLTTQPASATTVAVQATDDIWLAGQPAGASASGYFGTDTVPANAPVGISVVGGGALTFSVTGSSSVDGSCFAGADGGCYPDQSGFSPPPASGLYNGPASALVGMFLTGATPTIAGGPAGLNYQAPGNFSLSSYTPSLGEIFFIGDGLTGTGSGTIQQFIAPSGATRLFIATADSIGASTGNVGALSVDFTGGTLLSAAPEPAAWALMLTGFGLTGGALRRRKIRKLA